VAPTSLSQTPLPTAAQVAIATTELLPVRMEEAAAVGEGEVGAAAAMPQEESWAVFNLIVALVNLGSGLFLVINYFHNKNHSSKSRGRNLYQAIGIATSPIMLIVFFLLEKWWGRMIIYNHLTLVAVILLILESLCLILACRQNKLS
jgi:hypothetical protein